MDNKDKIQVVRNFYFQKETTYIEKQEITVEAGATFNNGPAVSIDDDVIVEKKEQDGINDNFTLKLMPICKDNEEYAKEFIAAISGKNGLEITETVKRFRDQKKIDAQLCHHSLWQILHDNDYYKLTERNWNERIKY